MADEKKDWKGIWLSKTFWMNVIGAVAYFWSPIKDFVSEEQLVMLLTSANVVMRFFTEKKAVLKEPAAK